MISSTLYFLLIQPNYHFHYPLFKSDWLAQFIRVLVLLTFSFGIRHRDNLTMGYDRYSNIIYLN